MTSLSVMGVGRIGGEVAFLAAATGLVDDLVLYDTAGGLLEAQVEDLCHTGLDITISTDPERLSESDIFVFAAGVARTPEIKTRADLLDANLPVSSVCSRYLRGYEGVLVTLTNPMDANNYYLHHCSGIERERCIGFGGQLDSARFGLCLKERGIMGDPWVLGEHGEHQVPLFSALSSPVPDEERNDVLLEMRSSSMGVIRGKGGTVFGPACHVLRLLRAIAGDENALLPCSCVLKGEYGVEGCSMGVPVRIGRGGIKEIVEWELDEWEQARFTAAAEHLQNLCGRAYGR